MSKRPKNKRGDQRGGSHKPSQLPARNSGNRSKRPSRGAQAPESVRLYGLHAVRAALGNPDRKLIALHATENALVRLGEDAVQSSGVSCQIGEARALDSMVPADAVHQGVVLEVEPLTALDASELFHLADKKLVLVLDQITDPHNVGAILRSAVVFAVDAVITTHRNSAQETGALAKSASGALDMVPIIDVRNLSKALEELNAMGFASFGLDSEGPLVLEEALDAAKPEKGVLVLGSEGKGLREKTRATCTHLARLDMPGAIKSLNVSNAAALSLYVMRQALTR